MVLQVRQLHGFIWQIRKYYKIWTLFSLSLLDIKWNISYQCPAIVCSQVTILTWMKYFDEIDHSVQYFVLHSLEKRNLDANTKKMDLNLLSDMLHPWHLYDLMRFAIYHFGYQSPRDSEFCRAKFIVSKYSSNSKTNEKTLHYFDLL